MSFTGTWDLQISLGWVSSESQRSPASVSPAETAEVVTITPIFLLGFCGCNPGSHAASMGNSLKSCPGSVSEAEQQHQASDVTFLSLVF